MNPSHHISVEMIKEWSIFEDYIFKTTATFSRMQLTKE